MKYKTTFCKTRFYSSLTLTRENVFTKKVMQNAVRILIYLLKVLKNA